MRINPAADLSIDIADLEAAFNLCRLLSGEAVDPNIVPQLQAAVDLYVGDLLEGWYQDWCLYERERLQNLYLALLDKLTAYCEAHGEYELGLSYGSRILDRDYARERTHQRLMRLHYLSGDRVAAIRQYEQCVAVLKRELGVRPSRRTVDLYKQICADQLSVLDPPPAAATPPPSLHSLLDQLGLLQGLLADFHRQLREHVEAAEYLPRNGP